MDALEPRHRAFLQEFQQMLEAGRLAHAVTSGGRSLEASRSRSPVRDRRPPEPSLTMRLRFLECELASLAHRLQCLQLGASGLMLTLHQEPSHSAPFSALTDWVGYVRQDLAAAHSQLQELRQRADAQDRRLQQLEEAVASIREHRA